MPRVSVVIPTHNRSDFLPGAIQSVLQQEYQDFEIIVVDDASLDNTQEVVAGICDPRIHYYRHEVKKHVSETRNTGIRQSQGEFVAFLDDDDEWYPAKLRKQIELFDSGGATLGAVYTGFKQVEKRTGRNLGDVRADWSGPALELLRARNFIATASTVVVRRVCFERVGLFDPAIEFGEEYDMWIRLAGTYRIVGIAEPLVRYFVHSASLSRDRIVRIRGINRQLQKHAEFFRTDRQNYSRRYRALGILYSDIFDIRAARGAFRAAVRIDPISLRNYLYLVASYLYSPKEKSQGAPFELEGRNGVSYRRSLLRAVGSRMPALRTVYRRARAEARMIRYAVRNGLWRVVRRRRLEQRDGLPRQKPLRWKTTLPLRESGDVSSALNRLQVVRREGGHAIYVPPQPDLPAKLGEFVGMYPPDAGFKILKNMRGPAEARYVSNLRKSTWAQSAIVGTGDDLIRGVNYLSELGISPRLYDVAELDAEGVPLTVFVTEHVAGGEPSEPECRMFLRRIRELIAAERIAIAMLDWEAQTDFRCPGCSGNLLKSENNGSLKYVDFQNFIARDLDEYLRSLVEQARDELHFGTEYLFRGGRYLYQRVPGVSAGGRRDTSLRWDKILAMLAQEHIEIAGRPVLDVGCNAGMMLAQALNEGALWGVGWDRPQVVEQGRKLLSALGYTRYTLVGGALTADYRLERDIPSHIAGRLSDAIVFYLAIRHHVGFLKSLRDVPWRVLLYEGPQRESGDDLAGVIHEMKQLVPCEVVAQEEISDADSWRRPLVLFRRT